MPNAHGYSGKPLYQKIGLKPGMVCRVILPPHNFRKLMAGSERIVFSTTARKADVVHLFCTSRAVLRARLAGAIRMVRPNGMLWISWPKKSSPRFKDLTEDGVREEVLPLGWVDVKVCAVDADWSGLKFLPRRTDRA